MTALCWDLDWTIKSYLIYAYFVHVYLGVIDDLT